MAPRKKAANVETVTAEALAEIVAEQEREEAAAEAVPANDTPITARTSATPGDDVPTGLRNLAKLPGASSFKSATILAYLFPNETDLEKVKEQWRNNVGPHVERLASELPVEWAALRSPKVIGTWPPNGVNQTATVRKPRIDKGDGPTRFPQPASSEAQADELRRDLEKLADFLTLVGLPTVKAALEFAEERDNHRKKIADFEANLLAKVKAKYNA